MHYTRTSPNTSHISDLQARYKTIIAFVSLDKVVHRPTNYAHLHSLCYSHKSTISNTQKSHPHPTLHYRQTSIVSSSSIRLVRCRRLIYDVQIIFRQSLNGPLSQPASQRAFASSIGSNFSTQRQTVFLFRTVRLFSGRMPFFASCTDSLLGVLFGFSGRNARS